MPRSRMPSQGMFEALGGRKCRQFLLDFTHQCHTMAQVEQGWTASMNTSGRMIRAREASDGTVVEELEDSLLRPFTQHSDWARVDALTDAEVEANALADPDNPPLTPAELQQMRPVQK